MSKNEAISPQELPGRGDAAPAAVPTEPEGVDRRVEERSQASVMGRTFEALQYPNYRLWFMGQLVSLIGTWMQLTAQGFLIFQLTHSTAYLGYVGFAAGIPSWIFMLYGGVIADRMSRRKLLMVTQTAMMILAFLQAGLTFLNIIQPWQIIVLAFLLGIANAFDAPARQAFVLELVDRRALTNAIALNSGMFNAATVVGPAVAGLTYAAFGAAWCFTINGLSFIAVIVALSLMHIQQVARAPRTGRAIDQLKEGLRYTMSHSIIRTLIAVAGVGALFGLAYATLLPAWAVDVLGGNAMTNGLLQSARGIGSLVGALMIASMGAFIRRGRLLTIGTFVYPVLLIVFAFVQWLPLSLVVLAGVGWGAMVVFNMANTLVQTQVTDVLRGRVMGVYTLTFFGGMPVGALWAGALANYIGPPRTIIVSGIISLAFALMFWVFTPRLRALA